MKSLSCVVLSVLLSFSVSKIAAQNKLGGNYTFEIECIGINFDGSQTLRVWGNGQNYTEAADQAIKIALQDVLFKGIQNGSSECSRSPLLLEPNAKQLYETYFFKFFAENGDYKKYAIFVDKKLSKKKRKNAQDYGKYEIRLKVLRNELKQKLIIDRLLN
jgi:hypothetical protein